MVNVLTKVNEMVKWMVVWDRVTGEILNATCSATENDDSEQLVQAFQTAHPHLMVVHIGDGATPLKTYASLPYAVLS